MADTIDFADWLGVDLRVATVLSCEGVPKSTKLLKFTLDDGTATPRVIVSGIAAHYAAEALVGKQVVFIANLPPRAIMGISSQGMLLTAVDRTSEPDNLRLSLLLVDKPLPNGAKVE